MLDKFVWLWVVVGVVVVMVVVVVLAIEIPITPMGVLAPRLRTLDGSACPPIDTSGNFQAHVSAESPLNTSPNPSEVIS